MTVSKKVNNRAKSKEKISITQLSEIRIKRLSAGSILKICFSIVVPLTTLGGVFGLFALFGFNTVQWNGTVLTGVNGLLTALGLSVAGSLIVSMANAILIFIGMTFISIFKTTSIQFQMGNKETHSVEKISKEPAPGP